MNVAVAARVVAQRAGYKAKEEAFTAGLLHAKTICIDRSLAVITSANLDRRSFDL